MPLHVYIGTAHLILGNVLNPNVEVILEQLDAKTVVLTFASTAVRPTVYNQVQIELPETQLALRGPIVEKKQCAKWTCLKFRAEARDQLGYP
ncbi:MULTISPECIES: hypothetical protein [unclassified Pseudomonas]|uniref:hypothetical protein n=1 Tax=unclassified Pseudomonas TaxID=196821 RepID=UPI002579E114|nr:MULTISPECIES: hypothetical protein [unclassified Pseudomonas]